MPRATWVWDVAKDAVNRQRHLLSMADGVSVLNDDMLAFSRPDPHPDGNRWQTVGIAAGVVVLFVVHTEPAEDGYGRLTGRIISVRKATRRERKAYEEGVF